MKENHISTLREILANQKRKKIAMTVFVPLCLAVIVLTIVLSLQSGFTAGTFNVIPGTYNRLDGARNGFNAYHMEGYGALKPGDTPTANFWQDTFCTHKDYNAGSGTYKYYYNAAANDATNTDLLETILNVGTPYKTGIDMSLKDWQYLRYCIVFTNTNGDAFGQSVYWSYLSHFLPASYSGVGSWGTEWKNDYLASYMGPVTTADFMGLGPISATDKLNIGDQCGVDFARDGTTVEAVGDQVVLGPFSVDWDNLSDALLAQLNCGKDKSTPPLFALNYDNAYSGLLRFYTDAACTGVPVTSVHLGQEFYVKYNVNSRFAPDYLKQDLPITVLARQYITTEVIADQFFLHPSAQNQVNVLTETTRPRFDFNVKFDEPDVPDEPDEPPVTPPEPGEPDYPEEYYRPTVDKEVTEDNHLDNAQGDYADVLEVAPDTDVLHKMTITSHDPKGTILTFQNTDYDLHPDASTTVQVRTAAELKAAIDANNKNIKQMADITIPANWTASATVFSRIFDGNGFKLVGANSGVMAEPIFRQTCDAVFYRVQFVGFTMERNNNYTRGAVGTSDYFLNVLHAGALVDYFTTSAAKVYSSDNHAHMIDCFVQGKLTVRNSMGGESPRIGGVAGAVAAYEINGTKALVDFELIDAYAPLQRNFYHGGMFGAVKTPTFENNELMAGSKIAGSSAFFGGMVCIADVGVTRNCKADYKYTDRYNLNEGYNNNFFGGLFQRVNGPSYLFDRCIVKVDFEDQSSTPLRHVGGITGVVATDPTPGYDTKRFSNCSVEFTGDVINILNGSGAGIFRTTDSNDLEYIIENCYSRMNMTVSGNGAAAGMFTHHSFSAPAAGNKITIKNCFSTGTINASGTSVVGGIAVGGPTDSQDGSSIESCVSAVNINVTGGTPKIGGIGANSHTHNNSGVEIMTLRNNLFAGHVTAGATDFNQIYNCLPGVTTPALIGGQPIGTDDNYTLATGYSNAAGPDGATITAQSFFDGPYLRTGAGGDLTNLSWYYESGQIKFAPKSRQPVQRIYVTDYYDTLADTNGDYLLNPNGICDIQQFIDKLYVLDSSGKLIPMWSALNAIESSGIDANDPYAFIDFLMDSDTFTFYMKVPNVDFRNNSSDPRADDAYQNIVKITPRDTRLVTKDGRLTLDWMGAWDDDWVIVKDRNYYLNIIKMTAQADYPTPLDGTEFTLYRQGSDGWHLVEAINPQGYVGATFTDPLKAGQYKLVETGAPDYYEDNIGRTWYLVFSGGVLTMYTDAAMTIPVELGEVWDGNTVTYGAILKNLPDSNAPKAVITVKKYEEDGTKPIIGEMVIENGVPRFTGAIFALERFDNAGEFDKEFDRTTGKIVGTGIANGYGNMILCGVNDYDTGGYIQDFCEITPGYYKLIEKQAPDGYAIDPTPIYIVFDPAAAPPLAIYTNTHEAESAGLDATVSIDQSNKTATINARNTRPEYKLTLKKYNTDDNSTMAGIAFELYEYDENESGHYGELIDTFVTAGANGEVTITLPEGNATYVLREALTDTQAYDPAPDYILEIRNGELYVRGGPHHYNFKIVRGLRDNQYYMVLDPDGTADLVDNGVYPDDVYLDQSDACTIGLIHLTLGVPNTPVPFVTVNLNALKNTVGKSMNESQFSFSLHEVKDGRINSTPFRTAQNDTPFDAGMKGEVHFDPLIFTMPGSHLYFLTETGTHEGWTMDPTCYLIRINVYKDAADNNNLKTETTYTKADNTGQPLPDCDPVSYKEASFEFWPGFTNVYGGPQLPNTGGTESLLFKISLVTFCLLLFIGFPGMLIYRKYKRYQCLDEIK